jgi:hypothetical protein
MPSAFETCGPISPPFDFNSSEISKFSPEVTGRLLLKTMCARLDWPSLAGKRLLDFGCGVRFARTIFNLDIEIGLYFGIDTNAAPIAWLKENLLDERFRFEHFDMHNALYNPNGQRYDAAALRDIGIGEFDAACLFSVVTHQEPADTELILAMLHPCSSRLYFTALIDDQVAGYAEGDPQQPLNMSTYTTAHILDLLAKTGWRADAVHPPGLFQVTAFVCTRLGKNSRVIRTHEDTRGQPAPQPPAADYKSSSQGRAVLVLGMHRSGTSAVSGVISALGVAGPKTLASPNEWNPRGYFESPRIFAAHDELLTSVGSRWDDWRRLDPQLLLAKTEQQRQTIKALLIEEFDGAPLIFIKDPRICRFVPLVTSILAELNYRPVAVLMLRNPFEVAHSLYRREKFALSKSILLWLRHVFDAELHSRHMPRCFLSYEKLLIDWRRQMELIAEKTGIRWPDRSESTGFKIDEFLTAELRHERFSSGKISDHPEVVPLAHDTYEALMDIVAIGESRELLDRLDHLRTKFNDACRTFEPMVADMEAAQRELAAARDELVAARDRLSSECAGLRSERDSLVAAHNGQLTTQGGFVREYDKLKAERDAFAIDNAKMLAERHAMLASTSWRVTAPLRSFRRLLSQSTRLFDRTGRVSGR